MRFREQREDTQFRDGFFSRYRLGCFLFSAQRAEFEQPQRLIIPVAPYLMGCCCQALVLLQHASGVQCWRKMLPGCSIALRVCLGLGILLSKSLRSLLADLHSAKPSSMLEGAGRLRAPRPVSSHCAPRPLRWHKDFFWGRYSCSRSTSAELSHVQGQYSGSSGCIPSAELW